MIKLADRESLIKEREEKVRIQKEKEEKKRLAAEKKAKEEAEKVMIIRRENFNGGRGSRNTSQTRDPRTARCALVRP